MRRVKEELARLRTWWAGRSHFTRHFARSLIIGLGIAVLLRMPAIEQNEWIQNARNSLITWQMKLWSGFERGDGIAWINIDENAYEDWDGKYITPRKLLLELIKYAVSGKPRVVVVDIDLSKPSNHDEDEPLKTYLQRYRTTCGQPCPAIVLARTFDASSQPDDKRANESFLDEPLKTSPSAGMPWYNAAPVFWGSVEFDLESDLSVRHWRLWEHACSRTRHPVLIPSAVFEAVSFQGGLSPAGIDDEIPRPDPGTCGPAFRAVPANVAWKNSGADLPGREALTEKQTLRRIVYRIPYDDPADPRQTNQRTLAQIVTAGTIAPADPYARPRPPPLPPAPKIFKNEIVLIGATFEEGGDAHHPTPIGPMPGSFVLINEMNSLMKHAYLKDDPFWVTIVIEAGLIFIISALFALYEPPHARILGLAVIVLATLTVGLYAFGTGFWFDSVVPLIAVLIHEWAARADHRISAAAPSVYDKIKSLLPKPR